MSSPYQSTCRHENLCPSWPQPTARLFQSREGLFGRPPTEYDQILRVRKAVEPYVNLWTTAKEWTLSYEAWTKGSFLAIDAETLEEDVERRVCGVVRHTLDRNIHFDAAGAHSVLIQFKVSLVSALIPAPSLDTDMPRSLHPDLGQRSKKRLAFSTKVEK